MWKTTTNTHAKKDSKESYVVLSLLRFMSITFEPGELYLVVSTYDSFMEDHVSKTFPEFIKTGVAYYYSWGPMVHKDSIRGAKTVDKLLYGSPFMILKIDNSPEAFYNLHIAQITDEGFVFGFVRLTTFDDGQKDTYPLELFELRK